MAKTNAALRERLLGKKKQMGKRTTVISNSDFEKARIRLLPTNGNVPGHEFYSLFCSRAPTEDANGKKLSKTQTSPKTFGLECLVSNALDEIYQTGSDEAKEHARSFCGRSTEYWLGVIDREDVGTPTAPRLHVLRGKRTVYSKIIDWFIDEDMGEDISDPDEGFDLLLKKEKTGRLSTDVEWKIDKLDRCPIHPDPAFADAIVAAAANFDVTRYFFKTDMDQYAYIYENLTGDPLPDDYRAEVEEAMAKWAGAGSSDSDDDSDAGSSYSVGSSSDDESGDDDITSASSDEPSDSECSFAVGDRVRFTDEDGAEAEGEIVGVDDAKGYEGNALVRADTDAEDAEPYSLAEDEFEILESDPEPEPEPEKEPVSRRRRSPAADPKEEEKAPRRGAASKASTKSDAKSDAKASSKAGAGKASGGLRARMRGK